MLFLVFISYIFIVGFNRPQQNTTNSSNSSNSSNCTYGLLTNGVLMYAKDCSNNPIPGSSVLTNNGQETIKAFCDMWNKYPNACIVIFSPLPTSKVVC